MRLNQLAFLPAALVMTACSSIEPTPTTYEPLEYSGTRIGFEETRIENDRWRVTFTGGPQSDRGDVDGHAMRRAAELALTHGYDWFRVVNRRYEQEGENDSPLDVGGTAGAMWNSRGGSATRLSINVSVSPENERRTTVVMEIIAGSGPVPDNAHDAMAIADYVR